MNKYYVSDSLLDHNLQFPELDKVTFSKDEQLNCIHNWILSALILWIVVNNMNAMKCPEFAKDLIHMILIIKTMLWIIRPFIH